MTSSERMHCIVDAINNLISLGVYPVKFKMSAEQIVDIDHGMQCRILVMPNKDGIIDLKKELSRYNFTIMGIPVEPDFEDNSFKVEEKENVE